jgi:tight adherence protein C
MTDMTDTYERPKRTALVTGATSGLGFEAAMLRVSAQWDNALTRAFRRAVAEMRVGTPRAEALQRMADRTGVQELRSFVAVLNQSTQLGVSIVDVLRGQAADLRERRRQRAEEIARQASVKMLFPLVFLIFPAIFVVILGPAVPAFIDLFAIMSGG